MLSETSPNSFTHSPSHLYYGFGSVYFKQVNSSETLDYRVIVIIHYGSRMPYSFLVFVYSFQRCKWRKIVEYRAGRRKIGKPKATNALVLCYISVVQKLISICLQALLAFVNFKLYKSINVKYPPILESRLEALAAGITAVRRRYNNPNIFANKRKGDS